MAYCRDCRDLSEWPERWMGVKEDLPPGARLVEYFMPFLVHLAESGLSKKTVQNQKMSESFCCKPTLTNKKTR